MTREEFQNQLPELVKDYRPAPDVLERISQLQVLILVGPSGVGKTTLVNKLKIKYVLSDNTRTPRPGEEEGVDFYFRSDYQTVADEIKTGRFVQVAVDSGGDLKATKASSYPPSGQVVMAIVADVVPIFRGLSFAGTRTAFITPPSYDEWMRRMQSHNLSAEQFQKRIAEAKRSFDFALTDNQTHFILSDSVKSATKQLEKLIGGQSDELREKQARAAAEQINLKLNKVG
jgi:guanylate kinase